MIDELREISYRLDEIPLFEVKQLKFVKFL